MSRIAGRRGRIYIGIADDTATAEPLPFIAKWSLNFSTDKIDVTALEDSNKTYLADLPDASGDFSGFYDDATNQTYTAAVDGLPRKFYLYPSLLKTTQYFFGTILPDMKIDGGVGDAVAISATWSANSAIKKVG